jgi:hypothetical protein
LLDQAEILFSGLSSDYKKKQLFVNKFNVINPVKVTLKTTFSAAASEVDLENKTSIGYYIPFAKSLEKLIKVFPLSEKHMLVIQMISKLIFLMANTLKKN